MIAMPSAFGWKLKTNFIKVLWWVWCTYLAISKRWSWAAESVPELTVESLKATEWGCWSTPASDMVLGSHTVTAREGSTDGNAVCHLDENKAYPNVGWVQWKSLSENISPVTQAELDILIRIKLNNCYFIFVSSYCNTAPKPFYDMVLKPCPFTLITWHMTVVHTRLAPECFRHQASDFSSQGYFDIFGTFSVSNLT